MAIKPLTMMAAVLAISTALSVLQLSSCSDKWQQTTHCVVTDAAKPNCSVLKVKFNCTTCQPLSGYIENVYDYFTNNTKMIFTEGTHCLHHPPGNSTVVNVTGVTNFTMRGLGTVSYNSLEEGATQPSSIISCKCSQNRSGILFYKSNTIHIENLTMEECGANFTLKKPDNFVVISALTFRETYDTYLTRLRMERNFGFGLIADRTYGNMIVSYSAFMRFKMIKGIHMYGGNARFWYSQFNASRSHLDTVLKIEHSWFLNGFEKWNRLIQSAAGLTILIYIPKVRVFIDDMKAINNTGNVAITIMDFLESTSSVMINNSVIAYGSGIRGSGLRFWVKIRNRNRKDAVIVTEINHDLVTVINTTFLGNSAYDTGGGVYISYYETDESVNIHRNVHFRDCQFIGNSIIKNLGRSYTGAAVQVFKHSIADVVPHISLQLLLNFTKCTFSNNKLSEVNNEGGILDFVSTSGIVIVDSNFTSNEGTAISLRDSNVQFIGHIVFENNTGMYGGALKLCQLSNMYLHIGHAHELNVIEFINNSATSMGGAIYVAKQQCVETSPPCFFQMVLHRNTKLTDVLKDLNLKLLFRNNSARLAGDAVYGGLVDHCYLININYYNRSMPYSSQILFSKIFDFTGQINTSLSTVSSTPYGGCFCSSQNDVLVNDSLKCDNITYPQLVLPGETITIGVSSVGQRNGTVPISSVYFTFIGNTEQDNFTQLVINYGQGKRQLFRCNMLNCTVYSNQTVANFTLSIQQASPAEQRYVRYKFPSLKIHFGKCPWGFVLRTNPPYECICDNLLSNFSISCNVNTRNITRPGGHYYWLGCSNYIVDRNGTNSPLECKGVSLAKRCFPGYCKTETVTISAETLDDQCSEGREGVLCSQCKPNHSLALGTSRCLPSCSAYSLYVIVAVCAAGGIMLVIFLITCNLTVSEGTINGLLFYAHVIHTNSNSFFPGSAGVSNANVFRLFIAWLNLDIGFELCFHRSITQYHKTWMQFGFLLYVWLLEFFIVILSHRYIFVTRLVGRNFVKVLATLFLISYAKTVNIAISSLEFASMRHSDGTKSFVWALDGNMTYLNGKHIPLFILGTVLGTICSVYTLILLFIQCLQKRSNICCLRWVEKLRPFFEAYTGPCHINYRFWPGFLFFVRFTLFFFCSILRDDPTLNLHITTAACVVVLIFAFVSPNGVYKRWPLNILEFSFIVNLGVVSGLVAIFCSAHTQTWPSFQAHASYFVYPSVTVVIILFVCILLFHCIKQIFSCRRCQTLSQLVATRKMKYWKPSVRYREIHNASREEVEPFIKDHYMPQVARFNHYREPLIEED